MDCGTCGRRRGFVGRPDPCIGWLPAFVSWACCGHGDNPPRVVFGPRPDARGRPHRSRWPDVAPDVIGDLSLVGALAFAWMRSITDG